MQIEEYPENTDMLQAHMISRTEGEGFPCAVGDTLLTAALRAGVGIAYECNAGGCGSCKVVLLEGEVRDLQPTAKGLKPRERERGKILACQCVPLTPCTISFREEGLPALHRPPRSMLARFVKSRSLTHDLWEFTFRTDCAAAFLPGQYAIFSLPGLAQRRCYSMSNLPNSEGIWQFQIRRVPEGLATRILFEELEPGSICAIDAAYSTAYLRTEVPRDIVCLAGGSGLAPMLSVVRGALACESLSNVAIRLYYGGREPRDIFSLNAFDDLEQKIGRICLTPVVSCGGEVLGDWNGEVGFLHECLERHWTERFLHSEFYLAGPPPMVEAIRRLLILEKEVPADRIHYDRFF